MSVKSFYDLDYIIEINEKRAEEYRQAHHKVLDRITNIILIYSGLAIFLIDTVNDVLLTGKQSVAMNISFLSFIILLIVSIFFTVRLLWPQTVFYLAKPRTFYTDYITEYDNEFRTEILKNTSASDVTGQVNKEFVDEMVRASYIRELEKTVDNNVDIFVKKSAFYGKALQYGMIAVMPYLICVRIHLVNQKHMPKQISSNRNDRNLDKMTVMSDNQTSKPLKKQPLSEDKKGNTPIVHITRLPGIDSSKILDAYPNMIKENSPHLQNDKAK